MKIQKRYIDKATEMMDSWYEAIDQYDNMVNELAAAFARIANEAAWDGWDERMKWANESLQYRYDKITNDFIDKYGPRPEAE